MAKRPTINTIGSGYASKALLNNNFEALRDGFDNTLSLDGSTPNAMGADIDLNSNDLLNVGTANIDALMLGGTDYATVLDAKVTEATTQATNAASSATASASSASAAAASLDEFTDLYLGSKTANPTVDNDGDPLQQGALYFNTSSDELLYYDGSTWISPVQSATTLSTATGDGSTTVFAIVNAQSSINSTFVYIDGVYQNKAGYTVGGGNVTFSEAPPLNAEIEAVSFNTVAISSEAGGVTYNQGGSGAVTTTVEAKLQETVSVKDFGAVGGGVTDDTAAIQAAVDYCTTNQKKLLLDGAFKITSPIEIDYANITIEGNLHGFGSVIYPHNCAAFKIDGTDKSGGYCFNVTLKDFTISGNNVSTAQDYCILLKNAYRCLFSNLRITQVPVDTSSGFSTVIKTEGTNLVNHFDRVYINGAGNTGSGRVFSIESNESSTIFMTQCDAENAFQGIYVAANSRVEMISPYLERCGTSIFIEAGTGTPEQTPHINIYGGTIDLPSSSSIGVNFSGTFSRDEIINIDGLRFSSTDHATKKKGFVTSAMTWSNDNKISITNVDWSWIDKPSELYHSAYIKPLNPYEEDLLDIKRYTFKITSLADNTATDVFKVDGLPSANPYEPVFVRVRVWESFNGNGRALEESVFVIQDRSDANSYVSI